MPTKERRAREAAKRAAQESAPPSAGETSILAAPAPPAAPGADLRKEYAAAGLLDDDDAAPPANSILAAPPQNARAPVAIHSQTQFRQLGDDGRPMSETQTIDDPIARAFGTPLWVQNQSFDWCRERGGRKHRFTRMFHLLRPRVLFDKFERATPLIEREIAEKVAAIRAHNEAAPEAERFGYLAVLVGSILDPEDVELARAGEVLEGARGAIVVA